MCSLMPLRGIATYQKGYRCYDIATKCTYVTMDVSFSESDTFFPLPSNSPFQGETRDEKANYLQYEWLNNVETETTSTEANSGNNVEADNLGNNMTVETTQAPLNQNQNPLLRYPHTHPLRISLR